MKTDFLDIRHIDCMELMREFPDKYFDLSICDPPYGVNMAARGKTMKWGAGKLPSKEWDSEIPPVAYFQELSRVSKNQIIFGGNYFPYIWPTRCFIVWDKGAGFRDRCFAEAELAWTSFDANAKVFSYDPLANGDYRGKIHICQKPVALYNWLLANYAKEGDKILDTHLGSGSIAIACHYRKHHLTACELNADYYKAACERIDRETRQMSFL